MVPVPDAALGAAICDALREQVERLGLSIGEEPVWADLRFEAKVDPFSQETSLIGTWKGARDGSVTLFRDGRVFAEYQVLQPHPNAPGHYVESAQVWGRPPQLRGEPVIGAFAAS